MGFGVLKNRCFVHSCPLSKDATKQLKQSSKSYVLTVCVDAFDSLSQQNLAPLTILISCSGYASQTRKLRCGFLENLAMDCAFQRVPTFLMAFDSSRGATSHLLGMVGGHTVIRLLWTVLHLATSSPLEFPTAQNHPRIPAI